MTEIALPITSLTALFAGMLILALTIRVVQFRRSGGVVHGDNDNRILAKAIRGHANAVEQLPIALILMGLAELQQAPATLLMICAGALVVGRTAHAIYFALHGSHWRFRMIGMLLTMIAQGGLICALLIAIVR